MSPSEVVAWWVIIMSCAFTAAVLVGAGIAFFRTILPDIRKDFKQRRGRR